MATNIGPKIGVDGEAEFRKQISNISQQLKTLGSEMKVITSEFAAGDDAQTNLAKTTKNLTDSIAAQQSKVDLLSDMWKKSANALGENDAKTLRYKQLLNEATAELNGMKSRLTETTNAIDALGDAAEEMSVDFDQLAFDNINQQIKTIGSEMKVFVSSMGDMGDATAATAAKNNILEKSIEAQKSKIALLNNALQDSAAKFGENDAQTLKWQQQVNEATAELNDMQKELKQSTDGIEKMADEAEESEGRFDGFKAAIGGIGAALGTITAAAGAAAVAMAKTVVQSFGELEQNLGGSEAVFVEYADNIQRVSEEAYRNMGVSQSQYLATANKMGALFQGSGLEIAESYDLTTQAMQRAADMASVMGIDMQVALDSVAGAAKGNFTMMDNLGVAMNATTIEAYAAAKGLDFVWKEASNADKARVAMEMFFENTKQYAGNFAREATETVSGSLGLLQAATDSFIAGLGNADADMRNLTQNMVDAFGSVVENVTPILENIVAAIPQATEEILGHVGDVLPVLLDTVVELFQSVLQTLLELLPELIPAATDAIMTVVDTLVDNLPLIVDAAIEIILSLVEGITEALPELIPAATDAVLQITETLIDNLDLLIDAALEMILAVADGLIKALPRLLDKAPQIIVKLSAALIDNLPKILEAGVTLLEMLIKGIAQTIPELLLMAPQIVTDTAGKILEGLPELLTAGGKLIAELSLGMFDALPELLRGAGNLVKNLIGTFKDSVSNIASIGENIVRGIWDGIIDMKNWIVNKITNFGKSIVNSFKDVFDINSPSRVMEDSVGKYLAQGIGTGFEKEMSRVSAQMTDAVPTPAVSFGNVAAGMVNGIQTALAGVGNPMSRMVIEVPVIIDGKELYRRTINDLRSVQRANPEVSTT